MTVAHEGGQELCPPKASQLLEAALKLHEAGFSVVPTVPGSKRPAIRWEIYKSRRSSLAEIKSWWTERPGREPFGLAVVSGAVSGNVTLDFDPAEGVSVEDLIAEAEKFFGKPFPDTCVVLSPSGGRHYHYILPKEASESIRTRVIYTSNLGKVEVRADGAICVMPPTWVRSKQGTLSPYIYATPLEARSDITKTWLWNVLTSTQAQATTGERPPEPSREEAQSILNSVRSKLTPTAVKYLHTYRRVDDRSKLCWQFGAELLKSGITDRYTLAAVMTLLPAHEDKYGDPSRGEKWGRWGHAWHIAGELLKEAAEGKLSTESTAPPSVGQQEEEPNRPALQLVSLADVPREPVEFLINPLLPRGELTLLDGDPGSGKSWIWMALLAGLTGSEICPVPYDHTAPKDIKALILVSEDSPTKTIRSRLEDLGADLSRIMMFAEKPVVQNGSGPGKHVISVTAELLEQAIPAIVELKPDLVVIDPITLFATTRDGFDMNNAVAVRKMLSQLVALARELNFALLAVRHFRKTTGKALYRGMGSIDFAATARSALVVGVDPKTGKNVLSHHKSNLAPQMEESLVFTLDPNSSPPFRWEGTCDVKPDDITEEIPRDQREGSEEQTKLRIAKDVLVAFLNDCGGMAPSKEIMKVARDNGISERTMWRAKEDLGIKHAIKGHRKERQSYWVLPDSLLNNVLPYS